MKCRKVIAFLLRYIVMSSEVGLLLRPFLPTRYRLNTFLLQKQQSSQAIQPNFQAASKNNFLCRPRARSSQIEVERQQCRCFVRFLFSKNEKKNFIFIFGTFQITQQMISYAMPQMANMELESNGQICYKTQQFYRLKKYCLRI